MTLNSAMAVIFRYFTEYCSFGTNYVNAVDERRQKCNGPKIPVFSKMCDLWWYSPTQRNSAL